MTKKHLIYSGAVIALIGGVVLYKSNQNINDSTPNSFNWGGIGVLAIGVGLSAFAIGIHASVIH